MKKSKTSFLLTLGTIACSCAALIVLSAGCDMGTYGERVQSTGGSLTPVSQDAGSTAKDAGSAAKDTGSAAKDTGSDTKDAGSDTKGAQ